MHSGNWLHNGPVSLVRPMSSGIGFDVAGLWSYAATRPPRTCGLEVSYSFD